MIATKLEYLQSIKDTFVFRLSKNKCSLCKRKHEPLFKMYKDKRLFKVCSKCAVYTEGRAFRKNA
ncbi:hypothetical protein BTO30_07000 [Domibacillus antri]|uniref:Uncharacterized protein n=1 Tax=Domibacillus antri TaxID=1714264 RepID=A0A1Q8Q6F9_9BACI|nr:hypothetical protein BTO30_07000 [Domibacillus antri]